MSKKLVKTLEKEYGVMFKGNVDLEEKLTNEEFVERLEADNTAYKGVDHASRTQFLKENGYEVNRANMLNADLSPKPAEPTEE